MISDDIVVPPRYQVRSVLGAGGMGQVLVAWDRELSREVALKVMSQAPSDQLRARFSREGRILAGLRLPQVVEVYDLDAEAELPWMAMELLSGHDLASLRLADPVATYLEVARGLTAVHQFGVVHRDVKPANILRTEAGRVVLIDFGLASGLDEERLTQTGAVVGSFPYMAPEVVRGKLATPAADWYSWGVCLYRALEGEVPFGSDALLNLLAGEARPPLEFHEVPPRSPERSLLKRCLDEDPARRPVGVEAIEAILAGEGARRAPGSVTRVAPSTTGKPAAPSVAPRAVTSRRSFGGALLAVTLLGLAWLGSTLAPEPLPRSPPAATAAPVTSRGESDPVGVDLEAELMAALDAREAPTSGFSKDYIDRGLAAFDALEGQAAWMRWLRAGGDPQALPPGVRRQLARVDSTARAVGLVAPFGEGWFLDTGPEDASAWARRATEAAEALRSGLAALQAEIQVRPERFPGADPAAVLLDGRARVLAIFGAAAQVPHQRREMDEVLAPLRAQWRSLLGAALRALDGLPPREGASLLRSLGEPAALRVASFGSIIGADPLRVQGRAPRGFVARYFALMAWNVAAQMARRHDFLEAVHAADRERAWLDLAGGAGPEARDAPGDSGWVGELRHAARVRALSCARERDDAEAGRRILADIPVADHERGDEATRRRLADSRAWLGAGN